MVCCVSLVSTVFCLPPTLGLLLLLIQDSAWSHASQAFKQWITANHWDVEVSSPANPAEPSIPALFQVTLVVESGRQWVDRNHSLVLLLLTLLSLTNLILSLLLSCAAILRRSALTAPWLAFNTPLLLAMLPLLTAGTFISFFVDLLLAIIFPVLAGLVLGTWVLLWRKVTKLCRVGSVLYSSSLQVFWAKGKLGPGRAAKLVPPGRQRGYRAVPEQAVRPVRIPPHLA